MIEIIKEAGVILKDLPDLAIWILLGILLYKILFVGSVFALIKIALNKGFGALDNHVNQPKKFTFRGYCMDGSVTEELESVILNNLRKTGLSFIHREDVNTLKRILAKHYNDES